MEKEFKKAMSQFAAGNGKMNRAQLHSLRRFKQKLFRHFKFIDESAIVQNDILDDLFNELRETSMSRRAALVLPCMEEMKKQVACARSEPVKAMKKRHHGACVVISRGNCSCSCGANKTCVLR